MNTLLLLYLAGIILQSPAAVILSGAGTPEDMDSQTVETLRQLSLNPVPLNTASRSRLMGCGLFTHYQVASILEYRERTGGILSFTELSLVDGIGHEFADAIREYVSLDSRLPPGQRRKTSFRGSLTGRYGSSGYLAKTSLELGGMAELCFSSKDAVPYSGAVALYGRRYLGKVVLGAFNARFGQGLALWSGMSMSGFSSPDAFCRHATGVSLSTSTSPANYGVAADMNFGRWTLSGLLAVDWKKDVLSLRPALNIGWLGRTGEFSITAAAGPGSAVVSADTRWHIGRLDIFSEAALDLYSLAPAAVLGIRRDPGYQVNWTVLGRWYSPTYSSPGAAGVRSGSKTADEAGLSAGTRIKWFYATADAAWHPRAQSFQAKALLSASPEFDIGKVHLIPSVRIGERFRPADKLPWKTDLRAEADLATGPWHTHFRWSGCLCREFAWLWYAEGGYKSERLSAYVRGGLFKVDNWDDRIYVYEKDVPGTFNVPAYYGRGWSASAVVGCKLGSGRRLRHQLNGRIATVQYPWTEPAKDAKMEWRVQYSLKW